MKKILSLTIAIMVFGALMATAAQAQSSGPRTMRARIPFAFHVGSKELPAGEYNITVLNPSSDHAVLQIRSLDGRTSAIVNTFDAAAKVIQNSKLAFHRYGQTYFFAEAQAVGESTTLTAMKSNAERIEAAAAARRGSKSVVAVVSAY
jgi:hypothetical protein